MKLRFPGAALVLVLSACPPPRVPLEKDHREPAKIGVTHFVKPGESLWRIGKAYGVDAGDIAVANQLEEGARLGAGQQLFIPGATRLIDIPEGTVVQPAVEARKAQPGRFEWPLVGVLYARFGLRGESRHDGIDIAAPEGTVIRAAGDGKVLFSGEQKGYGQIVIVQHDDGLLTIYAHNSENLVKDGAAVKTGQQVARVGQSGKTSGPHLHFEVREGGAPKDPLKFLPTPR